MALYMKQTRKAKGVFFCIEAVGWREFGTHGSFTVQSQGLGFSCLNYFSALCFGIRGTGVALSKAWMTLKRSKTTKGVTDP